MIAIAATLLAPWHNALAQNTPPKNNPASIYAEATLSSQDILEGEPSYLTVRIRGGKPDNRPPAPSVPGCAVNFVRSVTELTAQRQLATAYLYRVNPVKAGTYTIPSISLSSQGTIYPTSPVPFRVHTFNDLTVLPSGITNHRIYAAWFPHKKQLYQGELSPISLKLYIPTTLPIATDGLGLPDVEKQNCLAWRFTPPQNRSSAKVAINGELYTPVTFTTTVSGIQAGPAQIGPATMRIMIQQSKIDPRTGPILVNTPVQLTLPPLPLDIHPLPAGAPDDFDGAIGNFTLRTTCTQTTFSEDESTAVFLQIAGRGNLESLSAPKLTDTAWKTIDVSKITRGEERRNIRGAVTFRQLLRPLRDPNKPTALPKKIPAYLFSYFDPEKKAYSTISSTPIPVNITATPKTPHKPPPSEKLGTAAEEMRGILGFINQPETEPNSQRTSILNRHPWLIHIPPAFIALCLLAIPIRRKLKARAMGSPDEQQQKLELKQLAEETSKLLFYRQAGRFIEQWLPQSNSTTRTQPPENSTAQPQNELTAILELRDQFCFIADEDSSDRIEPDRKKEILELLKRCSKIASCLLLQLALATSLSLISLSSATAANTTETASTDQASQIKSARKAWKQGHYTKAIDLYHAAYPSPTETPADIFYNMGNCHHRLDQPGLAALYWQRALSTDPTHLQARQNLRFVEVQQSAIVPQQQRWKNVFSFFHPHSYRLWLNSCLWLFVLTLLGLFILRPRQTKAVCCIALVVITPAMAAIAALALYWYPNNHHFCPPAEQAVLLEDSPLYPEAHRDPDHHLAIPAASLLKINASRGPWSHVTTADQKSGWIPSRQLEKIGPNPAH